MNDSTPGEPGPEEIWQQPAAALLGRLATTVAGLTGAEARKRLVTHGPNDAAALKQTPLWLQFHMQRSTTTNCLRTPTPQRASSSESGTTRVVSM